MFCLSMLLVNQNHFHACSSYERRVYCRHGSNIVHSAQTPVHEMSQDIEDTVKNRSTVLGLYSIVPSMSTQG